MVFVGDSVKQKGDSKWHRGIFLKSMSNDMFLTAVGGTLKFSRSVKMIFPQWHEHMGQYRQVLTFPWQLEGSVGSRVNPTVRDPDITAFAVPGIDDEAADDPIEDTSTPLMIEDLVPIAGTGRRNTPPPPTAVVSAPADASETATTATAMPNIAEPLTIDQAGLPAPSLQPPGPMTPGMEIAMDVTTGDAAEGETADVSEPDSKRPRLSAMRVGEETLFHVDVDNSEIMQELEEHGTLLSDEILHDSMFSVWDSDELPRELTEDDLWQPYSALEPTLDSLQLEKIDEYADSIEIERLLGMKVIANRADFTGELGTQLSAKFVRSWRKKTRKQCDSAGKVISETQGWLRRSRLVAREYNWMDIREDVYSPSSSSSIVKLLPSLCMSDGFNTNCILGTLDIGDAFLQVDQPIPRVVRLGDRDFVIQKCLPGQREASKLWYLHFVKVLKEKFNAEVCKEQPCILRVGRKLAMLLHVDDVLFLGDEKWIEETFLPELRKDFKVSSTVVNFEKGGSFEFLKRYHVIEPFYSEITVHPEEKHIHSMFERYGKLNGKPPKLAKTPCYASSTPGDAKPQKPLSNEMAAEFRSLVGIAMYVAQERFDLKFATKILAQSLKSPTMQSWIDLGRLIAYAKYSEHFSLRMKRTSKGMTFQAGLREVETESKMNVIETFSDSDWSNRSTSSAIHVLNGNVIWSTSRTQKCVALSSTEAEWYAATSGVCDGLFLRHVISFLCDDEVETLTLHTDNSAVRMLSRKLGAGRLRHIRGRLLWLQEKVANNELIIKQIKTNFNIADINTKALNKDRHHCLLFMLGFVCNGDAVGESEFSKMEAKELLKQQVKLVSHAIADQTQSKSTSKLNQFAKQVLRIISTWSVVTMAEGQQVSGFLEAIKPYKALSLWHVVSSPMVYMMAMGFIFMLAFAVFMIPYGTGDQEIVEEPDPEGGSNGDQFERADTVQLEPIAEPPTSQFAMHERSLGAKYPSVLSDPMVRPEGILVWLHKRCELRVRRDYKVIQNRMRMQTLSEMLHVCLAGMNETQTQTMRDSLIAMNDLSDDENSPRHQVPESQFLLQVQQTYQAYEIAASRIRRAVAMQTNAFGENLEDEGEEEMYDRYAHSNLSDVSQPDLWMEIHNQDESREERYHRYLFAERDEVSDGEYWDELFEQAMYENEEIARRSPEETLRELDRNEDDL